MKVVVKALHVLDRNLRVVSVAVLVCKVPGRRDVQLAHVVRAHLRHRGQVLIHEPRPPVAAGHGLRLPNAAISAKELQSRPGC